MRVIRARPLSLDVVIEGVFYRYDTVRRMEKLPENIIIGSYEQHPNLLIYRDKAIGYIIKYGGIASHLAIIGRELGIPIYRYDIDKLHDGEQIRVIPYIEQSVIPKKLRYKIRIIGGNPEKQLKQLLSTLDTIPFKIENVEYKKREYGYSVTVIIGNFEEIVQRGITDPRYLREEIVQCKNRICNVISSMLADYLFEFLVQRVGYDNALQSINRHTPYWSRIDEWYLRTRFPDTKKEVIGELKKIKKGPYKKLKDKEEEIAELIAFLIENYERKNIV